MSDVTTTAAVQVQFEEINLFEVLRSDLPDASLADYVHHDADRLHKDIQFGLNAPVKKLFRAETFIVPVHPSKVALRTKKRGVDQKIARLERTSTFVAGESNENEMAAEYLLLDAFRDLTKLTDMALDARCWPDERIDAAQRTMAGELLSSREGWGWWLGAAIGYEERKQEHLRKLLR